MLARKGKSRSRSRRRTGNITGLDGVAPERLALIEFDSFEKTLVSVVPVPPHMSQRTFDETKDPRGSETGQPRKVPPVTYRAAAGVPLTQRNDTVASDVEITGGAKN